MESSTATRPTTASLKADATSGLLDRLHRAQKAAQAGSQAGQEHGAGLRLRPRRGRDRRGVEGAPGRRLGGGDELQPDRGAADHLQGRRLGTLRPRDHFAADHRPRHRRDRAGPRLRHRDRLPRRQGGLQGDDGRRQVRLLLGAGDAVRRRSRARPRRSRRRRRRRLRCRPSNSTSSRGWSRTKRRAVPTRRWSTGSSPSAGSSYPADAAAR